MLPVLFSPTHRIHDNKFSHNEFKYLVGFYKPFVIKENVSVAISERKITAQEDES